MERGFVEEYWRCREEGPDEREQLERVEESLLGTIISVRKIFKLLRICCLKYKGQSFSLWITDFEEGLIIIHLSLLTNRIESEGVATTS